MLRGIPERAGRVRRWGLWESGGSRLTGGDPGERREVRVGKVAAVAVVVGLGGGDLDLPLPPVLEGELDVGTAVPGVDDEGTGLEPPADGEVPEEVKEVEHGRVVAEAAGAWQATGSQDKCSNLPQSCSLPNDHGSGQLWLKMETQVFHGTPRHVTFTMMTGWTKFVGRVRHASAITCLCNFETDDLDQS